MSDYSFGWAVGFYEGEGTCCAVKTNTTRGMSLRLSAAQKDREPLERMVEEFGGSINAANNKTIFRWVLTGAKAERVAERMLPYLSQRRQDQIRAQLARIW